MDGGMCTLKLRLPNGQTLEETFGEFDTLVSVASYVREMTGMKNFLLSVPMPRRIFAPEELNITLKDAGLAPRGMLIVQAGIATDMKQDKTPIVTKSAGVAHVHSAQEYATLKGTPNKLVIVDFSAEWCGPCKMIAPKFEEMAKKYSDCVFIHLDVDQVQVPDSADVSGIPTFKFFKNGKLLHQFSGADAGQLEDSVRKFK